MRALCLVIVLVLAGGCFASASAQSALEEADTAHVDTLASDSVHFAPYRTERNLAQHILAAPSYLLHAVTRPLGWGVKWTQVHFPELFEGELPTVGAYPLLRSDQRTGLAGGAAAYHHDLFGRGHRAEVRALLGARMYNEFGLSYQVPDVLGKASALEVEGHYFNDPHEGFFPGGNDSRVENQEVYAIEQGDAGLRLSLEGDALLHGLGGAVTARYRRAHIGPGEVDDDDDDEEGDDDDEGIPLPLDHPDIGTSDFLSVGVSATVDRTWVSASRIISGRRLQLSWTYTEELGGDHYRFGRYRLDVQQFVPLSGILPPGRRLALRALLEKVLPLGEGTIPFYELSRLGSAETLRGFRGGRFRDEGLLLLTAEYRYPIWDSFDALLFVDAGQVFDAYGDLALDAFHWDAGGGFHVLAGGETAFRLEVAVGPNHARTILTVRPLFGER